MRFFRETSPLRRESLRAAKVPLFWIVSVFLLFRAVREYRFVDVLFLLSLTVLCGWRLPWRKWRGTSKAETICFFVLSAYFALALWGNYFLYVPGALTWEIVPCTIWACFMAWAVLDWMDAVHAKCAPDCHGRYWAKWAALVALILAPLLLYHEAFNPAILSIDSNEQIGQAIGALDPSDWHSPLYTLCIRFLLGIRYQISFVVVVQLMLAACVLATCAMALHRLGISFYPLCVGVCLFVMMPTNAILINTLWKDVPFSLFLLLLTYSLLRILEELHETAPRSGVLWRQAVLCGLSMAAVFLFRQNGIAPFIGAAAVLIGLALRYRRWLLIGGVVAATLVAGVVKGPVYYDLFQFERAPRSSDAKYSALLHDIQGVYYASDNFSGSSKELLNQLVPDLLLRSEDYNPTWVTDEFFDVEDVTLPQFAGLYLDTFIRNPLLTIRGMLVRANSHWSILLRDQKHVSVTAYTESYIMGGVFFPEEIEELGLERRESFFTTALNRLIDFTKEPIPASVFWSFGFWTAALFFVAFHCAFRKKGRILWALAPVWCNLAALLLFSGWHDYRYGYATFLVGAFFSVYALAYRPKRVEEIRP